uniref:Cytochrome b561 and DOMON domain-containing protein n=1 Tax=Araucaria cunninghamii TaxID=56994 RepID=A0A0D6R3Z4_ARACU
MANLKGFWAVAAMALLLLTFVSQPSRAQTCTKSYRVSSSNQEAMYSSCQTLQQLSANLAWTYEAENGSINMAFTAKPDTSGGWVSWGLNPAAALMGGTRSLIAFKHSNGTVVVTTYNVTNDNKGQIPLQPSPIDYKVQDMSAQFTDNQITMFATWTLRNNKTNVFHVWQTGGQVKGLVPQVHGFAPANLQSAGTIDLKTGLASASSGIPHLVLKNRHGVLNAVGWGIVLPIGIIIARYLRSVETPDPAWFYLHIFCQISGYALGVAGWATGLKLGSYSKGVVYNKHRNIGFALFAFGTLQMFALLLRPNKEHKLRKYWNIYHHSVGYAIVVLSIVNIFEGFDILHPRNKWKHAYIAVIASLGGVALLLEIISWIAFFQKRSRTSSKSSSGT